MLLSLNEHNGSLSGATGVNTGAPMLFGVVSIWAINNAGTRSASLGLGGATYINDGVHSFSHNAPNRFGWLGSATLFYSFRISPDCRILRRIS